MKVSKLENKNGYQSNCEFRDEILQKIPGDRSDADNNFLYFMEDLDALVEESKRMHEYLKERQVAGNLKHCKGFEDFVRFGDPTYVENPGYELNLEVPKVWMQFPKTKESIFNTLLKQMLREGSVTTDELETIVYEWDMWHNS